MKRKPLILDTMPVFSETVKAEQFLKLMRESPCIIKSSRVVAPRLGERGFGGVQVEYFHPQLRSL